MRCATFPRHLGKQIARALIADRVLDKKNVGRGFFFEPFWKYPTVKKSLRHRHF